MKLAIFDFDGTLFPKETMNFLLSQWRTQNYSKYKLYKTYSTLLPMYIKYKIGINYGMSKQEMREMAVTKFNLIFRGMTEQEIDRYFQNSFQKMKELLNQAVINEIKVAKDDGFHTVIVSGAYRHFLDYFGEELGIDTVIGTEIYFADGLYDQEKDADIITGPTKINKLNVHFNNEICWSDSRAFADSIFDLPLLEAVGQPTAVRPDNELKAIANTRNWRILH